MDELQLVRQSFGELPPPDPHLTAAAKARMFAGGPAIRRRFARRPLTARPNGLVLQLGIPAVAAAAVVAVAVGWSDYSGVGSATSYLFQTVPAVLEMPVTPAVRAVQAVG